MKYIQKTGEFYSDFAPYRWTENSDAPFTPIGKPLNAMRVALISSAAVYRGGYDPYRYGRDDHTFREYPPHIDTRDLTTNHYAFNKQSAFEDINCVFPVDRFRELEQEGFIGRFLTAMTFMGAIFSRTAAMRHLFPSMVTRVKQAGADLAFLVPV